MHVAHEQGIVHRDLKPSNILLKSPFVPLVDPRGVPGPEKRTPTPTNGHPGRLTDPVTPTKNKPPSGVALNAGIVAADYGVPKIVDFGLAKLLNSEAHVTRTGNMMGTPSTWLPSRPWPARARREKRISWRRARHLLSRSHPLRDADRAPPFAQRVRWKRSFRCCTKTRCRRHASSPGFRTTWRRSA